MAEGVAPFPAFGAPDSRSGESGESSTGPLRDGGASTRARVAHAHGLSPPEAQLQAGHRVAQYEIIKRIGSGGYGAVYEARDLTLQRVVAIKTVRPRGGAPLTRAAMDQLASEARRVAQLRHPNIITVHELLEDETCPMLVMEYFPGQPFERWCFDSRARWPTIVRQIIRAAEALDCTHRAGIQHRDVSSANLLVDGDELRLVDFGLAALGAEEHEVHANLGTRSYAAPELRHVAPTELSDQFSLAVVLARSLYADSFDRAKPLPVRRHTALGGRRVPARLRRALQRALRPTPQHRFESCESFASALDELLARRRRLRWVAAGSLALGGVALAATSAASAQSCTGAGSEIEQTWPQGRQQALASRMRAAAPGPQGQVQIRTTMGVAQRFATRWTGERRELCEAKIADDLPAEEVNGRELCLDRQRDALESGLAVLEEAPKLDASVALSVFENLPSFEGCSVTAHADAQALVSAAQPASEDADLWALLGRARAMRAVADYAGAGETLGDAQALLDRSNASPTSRARVELERGRVLEAAGHYRDAEGAFRSGLAAAERSGSPTLRMEALVGLAQVLGVRLQQRAAATELLRVAEALLEGLGLEQAQSDGAASPSVAPFQAPIVLVRAEIAYANSDSLEALKHYGRLLEMSTRTFDRLLVEERLAVTHFFFHGGNEGRLRAMLDMRERLSERYGAGHPRTLRLSLLAASATLRRGYERDARADLEVIKVKIDALPVSPRREELRSLWHTVVGQLEFRLGDYVAARQAFQAALDVERARPVPDVFAMGRALTRVGSAYSLMGNHLRAIEFHEQSVAIIEGAGGPDHAILSMPYVNLGGAYERMGKLSESGQAFLKAARMSDSGPRRLALAYHAGIAFRRSGDHHEAELVLRELVAIAEDPSGATQALLEITYERAGADAVAAQEELFVRQGHPERCAPASFHHGELTARCLQFAAMLARDRGDMETALRHARVLQDFLDTAKVESWIRDDATKLAVELGLKPQ